jgi:acyl-CoA synthetase (AMP-forming)/AMP-acid ligase II
VTLRSAGDLLAQHVQRHGDCPALICGDRSLSFATLDARANRTANALAVLGVGKGDRVALFAANSPEWVELFFATSKLGAPLVPISARLRRAEVGRIVTESRPAILIFDADRRDEVEAWRADAQPSLRFVELDAGGSPSPWAIDYDSAVDAANADAPTVDVRPEDLHSICYTAGTTGEPKGAMLTHANVVVGTHEFSVRNFGYSSADVFLNVTPLAHRAGWARLIQSIGVGACQVLLRRFDAEETMRLIERHRVTLVGFVPTMIRLIDQAGVAGRFDHSSLKTIIATAEACPLSVRTRVFELFPSAELLTLFASTEAGQIAVLPSAEQLRRPTASGRPLDGIAVRILDDDGDVVETGEVGEIAVRTGEPGSSGVMLGYVGGASANAGVFEDGWFRTGDSGYVDDDGYLFVSDRKKDMILSGGLNIFSREVEDALRQHPGVGDVAVIGVPDATWGESVVAVVVRAPEAEMTEDDVIAHCRASLASYKKPRQIHFVDALPRNAAGKVLKYLLRERYGASAAGAGDDRRAEAENE